MRMKSIVLALSGGIEPEEICFEIRAEWKLGAG